MYLNLGIARSVEGPVRAARRGRTDTPGRRWFEMAGWYRLSFNRRRPSARGLPGVARSKRRDAERENRRWTCRQSA